VLLVGELFQVGEELRMGVGFQYSLLAKSLVLLVLHSSKGTVCWFFTGLVCRDNYQGSCSVET